MQELRAFRVAYFRVPGSDMFWKPPCRSLAGGVSCVRKLQNSISIQVFRDTGRPSASLTEEKEVGLRSVWLWELKEQIALKPLYDEAHSPAP